MPRLRRSRLLIATQRNSLSVAAAASVVGRVKELAPVWLANRYRMVVIDKWARCELDQDMMPVMPNDATDEFRRLRDSSSTPFGRVIVTSVVENTVVDDIRLAESKDSAPAARLWQRNGLDARQVPLHTSAATFGQAYNLVLPATGRLDGEATAVIRGKSALRAVGFYRDDFDEYPEFFLEGEENLDPRASDKEQWRLFFTDLDATYELVSNSDFSEVSLVQVVIRHNMGLCPVVRFANEIDLDGRVTGEIAPVVNLLARIDQDTQDRLVVQRFASWVVRTATGLKRPPTEDETKAMRLALGIGDLLISDSGDTTFGSLPASPMDGHLRARDQDVRDLSSTSQTPSYHLLGLSDNIGADGLAAAEASHMRKIDLRKLTWGEAHEASLRLGGYAMGDDEIANDFESRMHWKQTRSEAFQSLAQAITFLVSAGVPIEMLVGRIADWNQADTKQMLDIVAANEAKAQTDAELEASRTIDVQTAVAKAKGPDGGNADKPGS